MDASGLGHHPSSAVLLDHVTGSISFAHSCVVATHLLRCASCLETVAFLETVGNMLHAGHATVEPSPTLREDVLASLARAEATPERRRSAEKRTRAALPSSLGDLSLGRLRWLAPGLRHSTLWSDGRSTLHYIHVQPGVTLPAHSHDGLELTCVLSGAYTDGDRLFRIGDVSEEDRHESADDSSHDDHVVTAERPDDCICIMATSRRLRFTGWMARLLQPVMPF